MAYPATSQNDQFASDLLTTQGNALTLNGLNSDQFLRTDVDSGPIVDNKITLGTKTEQFKEIWTHSINGEDFSHFMRDNKTNYPTVNSDGSTGFDFGSSSRYWRKSYFREVHADVIRCANNIFIGNTNTPFSHKKLSDIGVNTHVQIDNHINSTIAHGATSANTPNTIVMRNASSDINCNILYGTAIKANYADIAEKYTSKIKYSDDLIGKVFKISNDEFDVDICNEELSLKVVGIVTRNPSYLMNDLIDGIPLGLKGLLEVYVIGPCKKGDILVSTSNGCLRAATKDEEVFKVALASESSNENEMKLIKCIL